MPAAAWRLPGDFVEMIGLGIALMALTLNLLADPERQRIAPAPSGLVSPQRSAMSARLGSLPIE